MQALELSAKEEDVENLSNFRALAEASGAMAVGSQRARLVLVDHVTNELVCFGRGMEGTKGPRGDRREAQFDERELRGNALRYSLASGKCKSPGVSGHYHGYALEVYRSRKAKYILGPNDEENFAAYSPAESVFVLPIIDVSGES